MNVLSRSYDVALANPPGAPSTGLCADCGEEFGDRAFEVSEWPKKDRKVCHVCATSWLLQKLTAAEKDGNDDILSIVQSVDEIAVCRDCDRFVCGCPS